MLYKVLLEYDGSDYHGWQDQVGVRTISGTLKETFKLAFGLDCSIVGASRTDAGVHAQGQVARITTDLNIEPDIVKKIWNRILPGDIRILELSICNDSFHPQHNVKQKTYRYRVFTGSKPSVFAQRYGLFYEFQIDENKLHEALQIFVGTHDFRSFCTGYEMSSTIKTIDSISIKKLENAAGFDILVEGKAFLHHMIRRIVGASLEISSKHNASTQKLKIALEQKSPAQPFVTAAANGLTLIEIKYDE